MTRNRKNDSPFAYRNLEPRRLLAADLMGVSFDFDMALQVNPAATTLQTCECFPEMEQVQDFELDIPEELPGNQLDLTDGSDGVFGTIDAENPTHESTFTAHDNGTVSVILSSSLGDSDTILEIYNSADELVMSSTVEDLGGFSKLTFQADAGETYRLAASATEGAEGHFQMTVLFEEAPPVDVHADEIGSDATTLDMSQGIASVASGIEHAGDTDVFQFVAAQDGEVNLFAGEMTDANVQLFVSVHDADGNVVASGSTNEFVETSFDVVEGNTYYVSISAGEGQTGEYNFSLHQDVEITPVDQHVDEIGPDATELVSDGGMIAIDGMLETSEDKDAFRFTADQSGTVTLTAFAHSATDDLDPNTDPTAAIFSSDLKISVFDSEGELVTEGNANEFLGLTFDTVEGQEYQILVDSENDVPTNYYFDILQDMPFSDVHDDLATQSPLENLEADLFVDQFASMDNFFSGLSDFNSSDCDGMLGSEFGMMGMELLEFGSERTRA